MMGPFKCPDCGIWWAGFEHRCQLVLTGTGTPWVPSPIGSGSSTVACTCWMKTTAPAIIHCPIHDVQVTLTA